MVHDSVSEFDLDAWKQKQAGNVSAAGAGAGSGSQAQFNMAEWRAEQAMNGMHEDRVDGPLFATEINNFGARAG